MKLYMIRHGQTTANRDEIFAGQVEVKLTEEGRRQAESIRPILEMLHFDRVYSSDLSRAMDTQKLAMPEADVMVTPLLREVGVGRLELCAFKAMEPEDRAYITHFHDYKRFGGESTGEVLSRVSAFLHELEESGCETVAAFAHAGLIRFILRHVLNADFENNCLVIGNCSIHVFEYRDGKWRLYAWNYGDALQSLKKGLKSDGFI